MKCGRFFHLCYLSSQLMDATFKFHYIIYNIIKLRKPDALPVSADQVAHIQRSGHSKLGKAIG